MVEKYVILANTSFDFDKPKQLIEINGEPLICRTIRLLKENGINDIIISSNNKSFDGLGVKRYEPINNKWDGKNGYWLDAFPLEILDNPTTYMFGDMYYSENLIKKIVETKVKENTLFCCYQNKNQKYIKEWDEPQAFKVVDIKKFKEHIDIVKKLKDEGKLWREPIQWELYRSMNGLDVCTHKIGDNCIITNDESCDIDYKEEMERLKDMLENKDEKKLSIIIPYYKTYELTNKLLEVLIPQLTKDVEVYLIDDGCNETRLDKYKDKINIIHQKENKGGAVATNIGIKSAKGKYIAFIDSDDMIVKEYIKTLIETIENHKEDVIFFDWQDMNNGIIVHRPNNYAPWKAIYKKDIVPLFREGWIYSYDVPFQEDLNKIEYTKYYIDKVLYLYNSNREGSLTIEKEKIRRNGMIRCEVIKDFDLKDYDKLEDIQRKSIDTKGKLYVGDTFRCDKEMAEYLMGNNPLNIAVVKIIEVIPKKEEDIDDFKEELKEPVVEHIENIEETKTNSKKSKKRKGK